MSRLNKKPILIPAQINFDVDPHNNVTVSDAKFTLRQNFHKSVAIIKNFSNGENLVEVKPRDNSADAKMHSSTTAAIIKNLVLGLTNPFEKKLKLVGVGFKVLIDNNRTLRFSVNYSQPVIFNLPEYISAFSSSNTDLTLLSPDKSLLGKVAAEIRAIRKPEAYKGKGIRYVEEIILTKSAKKK